MDFESSVLTHSLGLWQYLTHYHYEPFGQDIDYDKIVVIPKLVIFMFLDQIDAKEWVLTKKN